jgi:hypothetical protein
VRLERFIKEQHISDFHALAQFGFIVMYLSMMSTSRIFLCSWNLCGYVAIID